MEKEDKMRVVKRCIEMIPDHGSIRISHVFGDTELNLTQKDRAVANYRSVAGLIPVTYGSKYIIQPVVDRNGEEVDYDVLVNPEYKKGFWARHPFIEKLTIALISGVISLMVGLTIAKQSRQSQSLIDKQQDSLIQGVSDSISKIQKRIDTLK